MVAFLLRLTVYWMGTKQIFRPPFHDSIMWLEDLPVGRDKSSNLTAALVATVHAANGLLQLIAPPEATRDKMHYQQTSFYYIAVGVAVHKL